MVRVCRLDELPLGESLRVVVEGLAVAVFHTSEGLFAVDDTCTHQDASLAEGWLEGCTVECPLHASVFDLRTGAPTAPPARRPVRTHGVHVVGDTVHLTLSSDTLSSDVAAGPA